jgi:hypothetical protein
MQDSPVLLLVVSVHLDCKQDCRHSDSKKRRGFHRRGLNFESYPDFEDCMLPHESSQGITSLCLNLVVKIDCLTSHGYTSVKSQTTLCVWQRARTYCSIPRGIMIKTNEVQRTSQKSSLLWRKLRKARPHICAHDSWVVAKEYRIDKPGKVLMN